jgi:hypothetical protein
MIGLDNHGTTQWFNLFLEEVDNLFPEFFLYLEPFC